MYVKYRQTKSQLEEYSKRYQEIQRVFFLKSKELSDIETALSEHLQIIRELESQEKSLKFNRIKLKNPHNPLKNLKINKN